jgi:hypothetical protein
MPRTEDQRYTDLLRRIAEPSTVDPAGLVDALREVERQHSMGHITDGQLDEAREAYAATVERDPRHGAPRSAETRADERD